MISTTLRLPRETPYVAVARRLVTSTLTNLGVDRAAIDDLRIALTEACSNAVEHGADGDFEVDVSVDGHACHIWVTDHGTDFDPKDSEQDMPSPAALRGRGIALMRAVTDACEFTSDPERGTTVKLSRCLRTSNGASARHLAAD